MSKNRSALRNHLEYTAYRAARELTGLLSPSAMTRVGNLFGNLSSRPSSIA